MLTKKVWINQPKMPQQRALKLFCSCLTVRKKKHKPNLIDGQDSQHILRSLLIDFSLQTTA